MDRQKEEQVSSRKVYKSSRTVYKGWAVQDLKYLPSMKELLQRFPSIRYRKSTRAASQCRCKSPSAWGPPRTKYVPKMVSPVRCPSQVSSVQCPVCDRSSIFIAVDQTERKGGVWFREGVGVVLYKIYLQFSIYHIICICGLYISLRRIPGAFLLD